MNNIRFSGFGQSVAGLYHKGAQFFGNINNFMNNNPWIGDVAGNLIKGNIGGAVTSGLSYIDPRFSNIAGSLFQGDFKGAITGGLGMLDPRLEGIAGNVFGGDFMGAATSALNMINPTLGNLASSFLADPVATIGGLAEQNGLGGLYKGIMGVAGGDYKTAMRELGAEIGVDPKYLGAAEKLQTKYSLMMVYPQSLL